MSFQAFLFYLAHPIVFIRRIGNFVYELLHPGEPWLSPGAVRYLDAILTKDMTLFEWGSGRSTLWFADRIERVVSIEYHEAWAQKVEKMLEDKKIKNVDLRYVALNHPWKAPTKKYYEVLPDYVAEIQKFSFETFDVIVIDGHYRLTCVDQCLPFIKKGGFLVIDNSNREELETWGVPKEWPIVHASENVMTRTTVWRKQ